MIGEPIPIVVYSKQEENTWKYLYCKLRQEVQNVMSERYLSNLSKVEKALGFNYQIYSDQPPLSFSLMLKQDSMFRSWQITDDQQMYYISLLEIQLASLNEFLRLCIPQLRDIDAYLQSETGFRIKAVSGMIGSREFLNAFGHRVFCCSQFIRHHSNPEYSPEPDLVHEFVGHLPQFIDKEIADISQQIGIFSCGALSSDVSRLGTLYRYTLEFGAIKEKGQIKGYGAGIAGSIEECQNFRNAKYEKYNPFHHTNDKNFLSYSVQPFYAYTESLDEAMQKLVALGRSLQKPFELYYNYQERQLKSTTRIKTHLNEQ